MSDELIKTLNAENSRLREELATVKAEARERRIKGKGVVAEVEDLKKQLAAATAEAAKQTDALTRERDEWRKKAETAPSEKDALISKLQAEVKLRDVKAQWASVAPDLAPGYTIEKLWRDIEFDPGADGAEKADVAKLVTAARESVGYGFKPQSQPGGETPPEPTPAGSKQAGAAPPLLLSALTGRGAPDTHVAVRRVKLSETLQNAGYMMKHGAELQKAISDGTVVVVPD